MARLTIERLRAALVYDPEIGLFVWQENGLRYKAGQVAGFRGGPGYWQIRIDSELHYAHRLAVFYMTGSWPAGQTDHIDLDKLNNRWLNLRPATRSENAANVPKRTGNSSTMKGVSWHARSGKWAAHIRIQGKSVYLGLFGSEDEAHASYCDAAAVQFGVFARAQ